MKNRHLYILASVLAVIGIAVFAYRAFVLQLPLRAKETAEYWQVEARLSFAGRGRPSKVLVHEARSQGRYVIIDQKFVSPGFGMSTAVKENARRIAFAKRRARGEEVVYYLFTIHARQPRDARATEPAPPVSLPVWSGAQATAARGLLAAARQESADTITITAALLKRLEGDPLDARAAVLLGKQRNTRRRAEAVVKLLAMAGVPARTVHGLELSSDQRSASIVHWLEVHADGRWHARSMSTSAPEISENHFSWWRGPGPLAVLEGGDRLSVNVAVGRALEPALGTPRAKSMPEADGLSAFSLLALPLDVQQVYRVLLVVPLGVLLLVVLRNVIGVRTFGTFMPVLIALAFRETGLLWGVVLFTLVVAIGLAIRLYFESLKLLVVPRLAAVLIVVIVSMAVLSVLSHKLGLERGLSVALFPMIILTMTVERLSIIWDERGPADALGQGLGSLVVAVLCFLVMISPHAEHLIFVFPELLLVLLAGILLLGRYSGFRLLELSRFKVLAGKED